MKSKNLLQENTLTDETKKKSSHQYIDELMAQVRYAHFEEVWKARLEDLTESFYDSDFLQKKRKHLKNKSPLNLYI